MTDPLVAAGTRSRRVMTATNFGDCVVMRVQAMLDEEHLVVTVADPAVEIPAELLREIIDGNPDIVGEKRIRFGEGVLQFGTEGEGLGLVRYEIDDPRFMDWHKGRVDTDRLTLRRIA